LVNIIYILFLEIRQNWRDRDKLLDSVQHAVVLNDVQTVEDYLSKGAISPNAKNRQGKAFLIVAVEMGHDEIVRCFLRHGADVNNSYHGYPLPHLLCLGNNYPLLRQIINECNTDTCIDASGRTILQAMYDYDPKQFLKNIANMQMNMNCKNKLGENIIQHIVKDAIAKGELKQKIPVVCKLATKYKVDMSIPSASYGMYGNMEKKNMHKP